MSLDVARPISRREFVVDYISPLICEEVSGQSGDVEINILPFDDLTFPSGFLITGTSIFTLTWDLNERALCYNVYRSLGPDGPYQLISSCQTTLTYSDDPGPGTWYYRISMITPEGEGPLTTPLTSTVPGPGPGPDPDPGCPAETGTATPASLVEEEDTLLGTVVPDPTQTSSSPYGTFDEALYKIVYTGGAYQDDDNPGPGGFKFVGYTWEWNGGSSTFDPDGGGSYLGATQAAVEVQVPIGLEQEFRHTGGTIGVEYARFSPATNPVAGSPNPTFELRRIGTFPTLPDRVRIAGYNAGSFEGSCVPLFPSAGTEFDGNFDGFSETYQADFAQYYSTTASALFGGVIVSLQVEFITDHPTSANGTGWRLTLASFAADASGTVVLYTAIKGVDLTPVGRYYRESGCKTGPACLVIEEY